MHLHERGAELAAIDDAIVAACAGDGTVVLVEGPAGIGKSSLLAAAVELAKRAAVGVVSGRGGELESAVPYGVVRQLLQAEWLARGASVGSLHGGAERALAPRAVVTPVEEDVSFGVLDALYWFVADLGAEQPRLVVVDDAQWADVASLDFLDYVVRRLDGLRAAVVVAVRSVAAEAQAASLARLGDGPAARVLRLQPLSDQASARVAEGAYGARVGAAFAAACCRAAGGSPHHLGELLAALREAGLGPGDEDASAVEELTPIRLARYVLRRVGDVDVDALALAAAMSILEDGSRVRDAARLARLGERHAARIARGLADAGVLRSEDPVEFTHPLTRRVITAAMTPIEREDAHLAAARLLAEAGTSCERVAAHLLHAAPGRRDWCVEMLRAAATDAIARSAAEAASTYLSRALSGPFRKFVDGSGGEL